MLGGKCDSLMSLLVYIDGGLVPEEQAKISVFDHGLLYGDGIFEGIRAYNGLVFRLDDHLRRLYRSAKAILLNIPLSLEAMTAAVLETIRANELRDAYVRVVVTRGLGDLGLDPRKCPKPSVIIIAASIQLYPEEVYEKGMSLITCVTRRNSPNALDPAIKSLNYLSNVLAKIEANQAGVPEGIMLSIDGYVAECTADNLFVVSDNHLLTPPVAVGSLQGITRAVVMELGERLGMTVEKRLFRIQTVYCADEAFLTGTAAEIVPIASVDGRIVGDGKPGPVTKRLRNEFVDLTTHDGVPIYS